MPDLALIQPAPPPSEQPSPAMRELIRATSPEEARAVQTLIREEIVVALGKAIQGVEGRPRR